MPAPASETLARTLDDGPAATAFDEGLAQVSRVLVGFMLVMRPIVLVVDGLTKGDWLDALLFAISVAVGITPQMLPVIVTTCLARGAQEMSCEGVIVKDLGAIQNLGAMDVPCCDKTGKTQMVTKDAVAEVLEACSAVELDGAVRPLTDGLRGRVLAKVRELGDAGMRVSALPAHDGAAAPVPGACLHRLMRRASVGQRGRGPPRAPPQVGRGFDCLLHAVAGAGELDL